MSVGGVIGEYDSDGDLLNEPTQGTTAVNEYDPDGKAETFENVASPATRSTARSRPAERSSSTLPTGVKSRSWAAKR